MIPNIRNFEKEKLLDWIKYDAGLNHDSWFGVGYKVGGIELQQVPQEYVELLWFLKNQKAETYLNVGIGKGGSFMTEVFIQENLKRAVAVDNASYWGSDQQQAIERNLTWLKENTTAEVEFHNCNSVYYLTTCKEKFDIIFIDGDHSYEGVKKDYDNALPLLNEGGYIVFHDINSHACPGVVKIWNDIKDKNSIEFIDSNTCGIGVWKNNKN
jgi:predicted O-methyltransferase YrrM